MYKQIPDTDSSIRPFQVYKRWLLDENDLPVFRIQKLIGGEFDPTTAPTTNGVYQYPLYQSIKKQYYSDDIGSITDLGDRKYRGINIERTLFEDAIVFSVPPMIYGEGIRRTTFKLSNSVENITITDDGYSNLYSNTHTIYKTKLVNLDDNILILTNNTIDYTFEINSIDINANSIILTYENETKEFTLLELDTNENILIIEEPELSIGGLTLYSEQIGNIFYESGIVVINVVSSNVLSFLSEFNIELNSTKTIYELEYFLTVEEDEFNVSQNPTAIEQIPILGVFGEETTKTIPIVKRSFISDFNPSVSGSFNDYEKIGILDQTGSFLAPYITTIGLYNNNRELLAIGKLTQPIKSLPDYPVNFVIRLDT